MKCRECGWDFKAAVLDKRTCAQLRKAARLIDDAFQFEESTDGEDYWDAIYSKLMKASERGYI